MSARMRSLPRIGDVPLVWKILVPFLLLMLAVGAIGSFAIVSSLSSRAQSAIDEELTRRTVDARSSIHDRELSLLESVGFAANLQGMANAVSRADTSAATRLLRSVVALKKDLDLVAVTNTGGTSLTEFIRDADGFSGGSGTSYSGLAPVDRALRAPQGATSAGFQRIAGRSMLVVASSICSRAPCAPVGSAIVGFETAKIAGSAQLVLGSEATVSLYDSAGRRVASAGPALARLTAPDGRTAKSIRIRDRNGGTEVETLYAPFQLQGKTAGYLGVGIPTAPFFASARGTAIRLAVLLLIAMAGIVAVGVLLSRVLLARVRPLIRTNRALGRGDLTARAPVLGSDELGELATGFNDMADQLQASHETLESRVRQRTEEVQRLLKERTQFFASVSHEFRTPLAVILGQVNLLRDADYRKRNSPKSLETIQESSQQLLSLIDDLLAAARAEAVRLDIELEDVRVADVTGGVRRTLEGLARSGDHELTIDLPKDLPAVRADPARLREILLNLVDNSVKYTPPGGLVELTAVGTNEHVEVSVRDTGPGIPKRLAKKLFEPFVQVPRTKTQRGQSSSGLGLALTKRLVEAQGGEIWFESEAGKGSTFTFTLRLAAEAKRKRS
jgi:signal transduction histidine kinase